MNPSQSFLLAQAGNQNPILGDSFLNSRYLNPDYLFNWFSEFFRNIPHYFTSGGEGGASGVVSFYHNVLIVFSIFFLTIISYSAIRVFEIRRKEKKHLEREIAEYAHRAAEREAKGKLGEEISRNPRWVKTLSYLYSQHPSDWKLAIIEADSLLEDQMGDLGFKGETLGEKLKSATQERFKHLSTAWEVHTIRNRIAHEGTSFELPQREAKRIIALYEVIFREYGYI